MFEVLFAYIQFIIFQIATHSLLFLLVLLGVPAFWLVLKLTNILYEDNALSLSAVVFCLTSIVAVVMFITNPSPSDFYKPLLLLLSGILTFLVVSPIFSESQNFEINNRKKYFTIDGNTFPVSVVTQVNIKRCFTRTKRSCMMELFISEEGQRARSIYFETNDINKFRMVVQWLKKYTIIQYDSDFTKRSIESPSFILLFGVVIFSLFIFCLVLPATLSLKQKKDAKTLPEYKLLPIPKVLAESLKAKDESLIVDSFKPVFSKSGIQIIVFDGAHSSQFVGNLRKALYSYPDQSYDYNIVFINSKGMMLKTAFDGKVSLSNTPDNIYTKFILDNCNKFCLLDNELRVFYKTDLETIDPRMSNVQDAINMLSYASEKRLAERKKLVAARQKQLERENEDEYEE